MDSANVENLYWIKTSNSFKKVIIRLLKRKGAAKIRSLKKNLKGMDLSFLGIRGKVYINDSLCKYHKFLWKNLKACSQTNLLTTFGLLMVPWRLKAVENVRVHVITHLTDLKELFPENQLLSED